VNTAAADITDRIPAWVDGELRPVGKLEAHLKGLRHKAVSVFVMAGNQVLIQKRAAGKYHTPGLWANTCCTHPFWGEGAEACALRRLEDELGITGLRVVPRDRVEYRAEVGGGMVEHEVVDIFIAEAGPDLVVTPNPDEVSEVRWIGLYDLAADAKRHPGAYTPWLRIYLERYMDRIFGKRISI